MRKFEETQRSMECAVCVDATAAPSACPVDTASATDTVLCALWVAAGAAACPHHPNQVWHTHTLALSLTHTLTCTHTQPHTATGATEGTALRIVRSEHSGQLPLLSGASPEPLEGEPQDPQRHDRKIGDMTTNSWCVWLQIHGGPMEAVEAVATIRSG